MPGLRLGAINRAAAHIMHRHAVAAGKTCAVNKPYFLKKRVAPFPSIFPKRLPIPFPERKNAV
ncbi:hypothetical protein BBW69_09480 [Neisseria sp. RH3002v2f]|nr:hypothetical protein [Neisseria sp. RH3002v2f]